MKKELVKISGAATGTFISAFAGVILVKMISLKEGPAGLGAFGLTRQFFQLASVILSLGNGVSIIESMASDIDKQKTLNKIVSYFILMFVTLSLVTLIFSSQISFAFFENNHWSQYFLTSPITFFFIGSFLIIRYSFSGLGFPMTSAILQSLPFITMGVLYYILYRINLTAHYFILFLGGFALALFLSLIYFKYKFPNFSFIPRTKSLIRDFNFEKTSVTTLVSSGIGFLSFLIVKSLSTKYFDISRTGLLEAAWSLSSYSALIFLSALTLYYLPKLKQNRDLDFARRIYFLVSNLTFLAMASVMTLKSFIIPLLFSKSFLDSMEILEFMLIGDYLRSTNWFFMFTFIALNARKRFVIADVTGNIFLVIFSYIAVEFFGIFEYLGLSYLGYQSLYFMVSIFLMKKLKFINLKLILLTTVVHLGFLICIQIIF